jgi:DNA repair protein SbcC/Rad50
MIKSIYLENWKTHLESKLEFKKGSNIILGIIGSGKSSIVDAICYGLYGTFPTLSNRKVSLDETIMFKPIKKEYFKIILELEQDLKLYKIEREVYSGNKANSAKIYLDGRLIAGPKKSDVDKFISTLLGIDYNLFIKVVYSQQNEIDYFLKIQPSKRKEQFDDLFGISHFENIKIHTRDIERGLVFEKNKTESLLLQINQQLEDLDITNILEKEKDIKNKLKELNLKITELNLKIKDSFEKLKNIKEIKNNFDKKTLEKNILFSKIQELEKELFKTQEISKDDIEYKKEKLILLEKEIKELQLENNKNIILKKEIENKKDFFKKELIENKTKKETLEKSIVLQEETIENINLRKKEKLKRQEDLKQEKIKLILKIKEIEKAIEEINKGHSKCPVCETPFSLEKIEVLKKRKNQELLENKEALLKINQELLNLETEINNLLEKEKIFEKNKILKEQINLINEKLLENEEKLKTFNKELENIPQIIDTSSKEKEILENKKEILKKEETLKNQIKIKEYIENKETIEKELLKIDFSEEKYLNQLSEYKTNESSLKNLIEKQEIYNDMNKNIEKQIKNYNQLNENKNKHIKTIDNIEKKKQNISYFSKAIDLSQNQLRNVLVDNINQALNLIWPKIYPYKDYISARLNSKKDYVLEVLTQRNEWIRVEGILSGGERACASLSIRIAISLILTKKLGLLILDEPTHNLDSFSIDALSNVIDTEMPDLVEQIFIVTHDKKLLETINANKYIIERDKENDSFSKIL